MREKPVAQMHQMVSDSLAPLLGSGPEGVNDLWYQGRFQSLFLRFCVSLFLSPPKLDFPDPWLASQNLWLAPDPLVGFSQNLQLAS